MIKRDNNLSNHLPIHSTIQLNELEKKGVIWKMNQKYLKGVAKQIQWICNNAHEVAPFFLKTTKGHPILQAILKEVSFGYKVQERDLQKNLEKHK